MRAKKRGDFPAASNSNVQICPDPSRGCPGCPVCPDKSHGPARVFGAVSWFFSATFWLTGCGRNALFFCACASTMVASVDDAQTLTLEPLAETLQEAPAHSGGAAASGSGGAAGRG